MRKILCILAGGRSSRFGTSKLRLEVDGRPIIAWLGDRLGTRCDERWLSTAPGAPLPPGAGAFDRVLYDRVGYSGPLRAISHALSTARRHDVMIIAAADMPLVEPSHIESMMRTLRRLRAAAVMTRWTNGLDGGQRDAGQVEPMPSIWRAGRGARLIGEAMAVGVRGPHRLALWRGVRCLPIGGERGRRCFANINAPADATAVGQLLGHHRLGLR